VVEGYHGVNVKIACEELVVLRKAEREREKQLVEGSESEEEGGGLELNVWC